MTCVALPLALAISSTIFLEISIGVIIKQYIQFIRKAFLVIRENAGAVNIRLLIIYSFFRMLIYA